MCDIQSQLTPHDARKKTLCNCTTRGKLQLRKEIDSHTLCIHTPRWALHSLKAQLICLFLVNIIVIPCAPTLQVQQHKMSNAANNAPFTVSGISHLQVWELDGEKQAKAAPRNSVYVSSWYVDLQQPRIDSRVYLMQKVLSVVRFAEIPVCCIT